MKKYIRTGVFLAITILISTKAVLAAPRITEVMYDPQSGGEWAEIYNPDDTPVDLKGWKLFDGTSHSISTSASLVVPAGGYTILADDKNAFVSAFNNVSVPVVDIVTSFNNDGDIIILRDTSGKDVSTVTYGANAGASKNGKTLQYLEGEYLPWFMSIGAALNATKDEILAATPVVSSSTPSTVSTTNTSSQTSSPYHAWPSDQEVFVSAGSDKVAVAGAEVVFVGRVMSAARRPLPNADLIWTFGDGGSDRATQVKHIFHYPGRYVVLLDVISGDNIAKDQIQVEVITPKINISSVVVSDRSYIEVFNSSVYDLDIGGWVLEAGGLGGQHFTLPKNTILLAGRKVIMPSEVTGLKLLNDNVTLKFPNGTVVVNYKDSTATSTSVQSPSEEKVSPVASIISEDVSLADQVVATANNIFSGHILKSYFTPEPKSVQIQDLGVGAGTSTEQATDTVKAAIEIDNIQTAAAVGAASVNFGKYKKFGWLLALVIGVVAVVGLLHFTEKIERNELGISKESDEYEIVE